MNMMLNSQSKAKTNTHHLGSITPLSHPVAFKCQTKIPNPFPVLDNPAVKRLPMTLLPADVVESHLQQPLYNDILVENMSLFEPTPIGHGCHKRAPSLDIKLLRDILNTALEQGVVFDSDADDPGYSTKRKASSPSARHSPRTKKRRTGDDAPNFRPYQETKWSQQYQELVKFEQEFGHCNIPHSYKPHTGLSRWVKRQRYQYKLRSQGMTSTMTNDRMQQLERLDFVWDTHGATWDQRFAELKEFLSCYGHCDVPSSFPSNPKLATWVKCQRRHYRLFFEDNALSSATPKRIAELEGIGFKWRVRGVVLKNKKALSP